MEENFDSELNMEYIVFYTYKDYGFQSKVVEAENIESALSLFLTLEHHDKCLGIMEK